MMPTLAVLNVHKKFNAGTPNEVSALGDISLALNPGEWTYIVGGNGSGKSTLLRIIAGELKADSGEIRLNNISPCDVYFVEQETDKNLVESMTVYENLCMGVADRKLAIPSLKPYSNTTFRAQVRDTLSKFALKLETRLTTQVRFLSGGEQQAVVAARILLMKPAVLLMDEFTSALDTKTAPRILSLLKQHTLENGTAVAVITHDYGSLEYTADVLVVLDRGKISGKTGRKIAPVTRERVMEMMNV